MPLLLQIHAGLQRPCAGLAIKDHGMGFVKRSGAHGKEMERNGLRPGYRPARHLRRRPDIDEDETINTLLQELVKVQGIQVLECHHTRQSLFKKTIVLCNKVVKY